MNARVLVRVHWLGAFALCCWLVAVDAHAQPAAAFSKGTTLTVVAPTDTGGSVYEYALLVANRLGRVNRCPSRRTRLRGFSCPTPEHPGP